ncbi:hypothetical protein FMM68_02580 [Lachnospiraceae bacterium MD329]|jgi:hypothetical protein|nr:hypothetical protein [Lachnospiraceae bacterium MD329]
MIQIENISVKQKYSISLWFNKDYTKENIIFGEEEAKQSFFRKGNTDNYEKENLKRNFGTIIEDGLAFAESDKLRAVRDAVNGLAEVLKQGRGKEQIEPYKAELFRIYNCSNNILEQYVILKLWHEFGVRHKEINSIANTMRRKQWEQLGIAYGEFADKMFMPFEKKFTNTVDVKTVSGQVRIETMITDKGIECVYTFDEDILPMYVLYMTELAKQGKHIRTCEICGREFVASRKDTKVCGAKCKSQRQAGYFKEHKEKVKDDIVDKTYQQNRDGYDNFIKKLNKLNISEYMIVAYKDAKYDFLDKGKKKRKAYKNGKLSKKDFLDWIRDDRLNRIDMEQDILELL